MPGSKARQPGKVIPSSLGRLLNRLNLEPYWYLIILLALAGAALYAYHLRTGYTPDRAILRIPYFSPDNPFPVYWYAILIIGGIALGSYATTGLAGQRARHLFNETVPQAVRKQPIARLKLSAGARSALAGRKIATVGDLLLTWGFNPALLGLNEAGLQEARERLTALPGVDPTWLEDAPWRVWHPAHVWNGVAWCMVIGLIGARLYHVLTPSPSMAGAGIESPLDYFRNPQQLINLRAGGLGIYGGIAGGALGLLIYTRRHRLPALAWADLGAVGMALGQAIGRWGNFFNQELYGRPAELPWAVTIAPEHRLPGYTAFSRFHPAFLYESLWNFLAFLALYYLARYRRDRLLDGDLTALYLIFYAAGRAILETVRLDSRTLAVAGLQLSVATLVSLLVAVVVALWTYWRHRRQAAPRG